MGDLGLGDFGLGGFLSGRILVWEDFGLGGIFVWGIFVWGDFRLGESWSGNYNCRHTRSIFKYKVSKSVARDHN